VLSAHDATSQGEVPVARVPGESNGLCLSDRVVEHSTWSLEAPGDGGPPKQTGAEGDFVTVLMRLDRKDNPTMAQLAEMLGGDKCEALKKVYGEKMVRLLAACEVVSPTALGGCCLFHHSPHQKKCARPFKCLS
jgi:hypothetical protein